jgi:predicted peptidase
MKPVPKNVLDEADKMRHFYHHLVATLSFVAFFAANVACNVAALEPPGKLAPCSTLTVTFPEMPATFYALYQKKDVKAQMTIFVPSNYDPARKHPLLVFLNGGDGGAGSDLGVARSLCEGKDFVCVSMPLFKAIAPKAPGFDYVMRGQDGKYMWPYFRTMLARLDEVVPNIDSGHRVLGGFSNGAHAAQGLIDESEGEVARRFSAFFFVEGGGRLENYGLLKGKPYLMVSSNAKSRPRAQQLYDAAKAAGARATLIFEDVGKHDFPVSAYPAVRAWLRKAGEVTIAADPVGGVTPSTGENARSTRP